MWGLWGGTARGSTSPPSPMGCCNSPPGTRPTPGEGDAPRPDLPGAPQSQHCLFPGMFFTSLMTSLVSSCTPPSAPPPAAAPPPLGSPLKALLRASSLLFCSTETHLGRGKPRQEEEEEDEDGEGRAGSGMAKSGDGLQHLHNAFLLVLRLEVIRPVVCRDGERGEKVNRAIWGCPRWQEGAATTPKGLL